MIRSALFLSVPLLIATGCAARHQQTVDLGQSPDSVAQPQLAHDFSIPVENGETLSIRIGDNTMWFSYGAQMLTINVNDPSQIEDEVVALQREVQDGAAFSTVKGSEIDDEIAALLREAIDNSTTVWVNGVAVSGGEIDDEIAGFWDEVLDAPRNMAVTEREIRNEVEGMEDEAMQALAADGFATGMGADRDFEIPVKSGQTLRIVTEVDRLLFSYGGSSMAISINSQAEIQDEIKALYDELHDGEATADATGNEIDDEIRALLVEAIDRDTTIWINGVPVAGNLVDQQIGEFWDEVLDRPAAMNLTAAEIDDEIDDIEEATVRRY